MSQQSLSDQAVDTLAAVRAMCDQTTNEHPERHTIRELRQIAEGVLAQAFRDARRIAYLAESIRREARESETKTKGSPA